MQALKLWLKRFGRDRGGNAAIIVAVCASVLITAVGGAMDFSRSTAVGSELQTALDSGVLAAASLSQDRSPEQVVRAYVEAALGDHPALLGSLELNVTSNISINSREVSATARVSVPTVILGLVGMNTIELVHQAEAIEAVRDVEIALVLDISGSMGGSKITAMREAATEFVEVVLAADSQDRTSISIIPYNGGVRTPQRINNRLINGNSTYRRHIGCLDLAGDSERGYTAPESNGIAAVIAPSLPRRSYDWLQWNGTEQYDTRSSSFCPEQDEESLFLTNNQNKLLGLIDDLDAGGYTGLDIATAWGTRALNPTWRGRLGGNFSDRPAAYDDPDTIKILVVMTDGAATAQTRTRQVTNWWGSSWQTYQVYSAWQARQNMAAACDTAEDNGVVIYTIAFQLSGNTNRDLMRNCANRPQNYYQVEDLNIQEAFSAIAAEINQLRLKK